MVDFFKSIGIVGFWFFLIKGLLWIVLFVALYFGLIDKQKFKNIKAKLNFFGRLRQWVKRGDRKK